MQIEIDGMILPVSRVDHAEIWILEGDTLTVYLEGVHTPVELKRINGKWTLFSSPDLKVVQDGVLPPDPYKEGRHD